MSRRGLFRQDLGEHPPEIQEFLENYWHRPRTRGGEFRRITIGAPSSAEVRENARAYGSLLLLAAVVIPPAYWKWTAGRLTISGWVTLLVISAGLAAFGIVLLRSSRLRDPAAPTRKPKSRRKSD